MNHSTHVGQVCCSQEGVESILITSIWVRLSIDQLVNSFLGYLLLPVFAYGKRFNSTSRCSNNGGWRA